MTLKEYAVEPAGSRYQRYDLRLGTDRWGEKGVRRLPPGKYEVKKLYRRNLTAKPDPRFKVGSRGETIYGRFDARLKAFALDVENYLEANWTAGLKATDEIVELIDATLSRRHSKDFYTKMRILAEAYDDVHMLPSASALLEEWGIQADDIIRGFNDLDGLFVVLQGTAGYYFTMVSQKDMPRFFEFDSVSVEGVKLRFVGAAPHET